MQLKIGLKVVCIDDTIKPERLLQIESEFPNWVEKNKEYTIRHIIVQQTSTDHVVSVLLDEIINPLIWFPTLQIDHEPGFHISRFAVYSPNAPIELNQFSSN